MKPLITVLIGCFNQFEYIEDAIESVFNQTYTNWEIIIIDNGSTDGSHKLLQKYRTNPKVRLMLHEKNESCSKRLNEGVKLANGEFISQLPGDDYLLPEIFEKEIKCFESLSREWGVVYSPSFSLNVFSGEKKILKCIPASGYILKTLLINAHKSYINVVTPLIRKECFERYPQYDDLFLEGEAHLLRIAIKYKFYYIDEPLAVMRVHNKNQRFFTKENCRVFQIIIDRLMDNPEFPKKYLKYARAYKAKTNRNRGWQDMRFGSDIRFARKMFLIAILTDWKQLFHFRTIVGGLFSLFPKCIRNYIRKLLNRKLTQDRVIYIEGFYR
jgi:glycosyltransferase involved in cell wall biosynthesis